MDFHSLGDRAQQVASIGAVFRPEHFAGRLGELPQKVGRHQRAKTFYRPLSSVGVLDSGVALGDEVADSDLQLRIGWTGQARLDRFVEPVQPRLGFGGAFAKIGDMLMPLLDPHASAVDDVGHHLRQPTWLEQSILQMIDDRLVDRLHPHGDAAAGARTFVEFGRAIALSDLPPLYVLGVDGKTSELVNYRVDGRRLVVDRLFDRAELRFGLRRWERRVRIERTTPPQEVGQ